MTSKYLKSSQYYVWFGKIFGISTFDILGPGINYLEFLYGLPFLAFYCYVCYRAFLDLEGVKVEAKAAVELSYTTVILVLLQHILSHLVKLVYFYMRRDTFKQAFLKIHKLNEFLKLREEDYTMEALRVIGTLCVAVAMNVYVESTSTISIWITLVHQIFYFVSYVEITLTYKMLNELARQCRSINDHLQKRISFLALDKIQPKGKIWNELLDVKKLRENEKDSFFDNAYEMAEAHLTIGQIARDVNTVFGVAVLLGFLSDFTMLTYTTVTFCQHIRLLTNLGRVDFTIMLKAFNNAFHDALILTRECYCIYYWTKLQKTLKATITCLHKMWNTLAKHNEIDEKSNYLQLLIVQLFNGMPNFSTFGIIVIDWPLIIYVISSAATYVVIIMQFQLATKLPDTNITISSITPIPA